MKKKLLIISVLLFTTLPTVLSGTVAARDNTALSVGTIQNLLDTTEAGKAAATSYHNAGYTSYYGTDLSKNTLYSYLYADVQFFSAHGASNRIIFKESGIIVGEDGFGTSDGVTRGYIGTNNVHWDADTILVTYTSCSSAKDNSWDTIAGKTCQRGANTVIGFRKDINALSSTPWTKRYNEKLAEGSTVAEAAKYANTFTYLFPDVKYVSIFGDSNLKIGKYRNAINTQRESLYNSNSSNLLATEENIFSTIKASNPNFDPNNYEMIKTGGITCTPSPNIVSSPSSEYIELVFKLDDFYTDAGYTIYIENDKIKEIYDNNIDLEKQKALTHNISSSKETILNDVKIRNMKLNAIQKVKQQYNNNLLTIHEDELSTKLYYNLISDKKYVLVEVPSKITDDLGTAIAYDTISYEI